jgi:hypothetical protein
LHNFLSSPHKTFYNNIKRKAMTLDSIKEEYKREVGNQQVTKQLPMEDLDQMFTEIDEATSLQEFIDVVNLWSQEAVRVGAAAVILKVIVDLHDH